MVARPHSRGVSLIEILISMVIGLVIIGVTFANYLNSGSGRNSSAALGQMAEDANVALNFLRKQITQAGYSEPYKTNDKDGLERKYAGRSVFGCNQALFADPKVPTIGQLGCAAAASSGSDSIAVAYEATQDNAIWNTTVIRPRDCIGSGVAQTPRNPPSGTDFVPAYYLAESRLYIANNSLMCQGNGQTNLPVAGTPSQPEVRIDPLTSPQPLVDNIVSMRITYGLSDQVKIDPLRTGELHVAGRTPVQFVDASAVGDNTSANWDRVVAVRICLVVRSDQEVLDEPADYYDCHAVDSATPAVHAPKPTDRRLYRAFSTTIMVQNRLGKAVPVTSTGTSTGTTTGTPTTTPPTSGTTP